LLKSQNITRKKAFVHKIGLTLMKLTTGVNFINILQAAFWYNSVKQNFSVLSNYVCIFWQKKIKKKVAHKIFVKYKMFTGETGQTGCSFAELSARYQFY